jgi:hypothetical protein
MKKEDVHIALGLPPPPEGEMGAEETGEAQPDDEKAEDDAIDAMFEATDPAARREAFRKAVDLCVNGGGGY